MDTVSDSGQPVDGIAGGSFFGKANSTTVMTNLVNQGYLKEKLYAFYLSNYESRRQSKFFVGGYDDSCYVGECHDVPLNDTDDFWWIRSDSSFIGDKDLAPHDGSKYNYMYVDSGSSYICKFIFHTSQIQLS